MSEKKINHGRRMSKDVLAVNVLGYILIGLFALVCVLPFYLIIVASFTSEASLIRNGYPVIPTDFSVQSYLLCLKGLVPWYMLCVRYLNMKNSYLGILLPLMFSVWNMIIAKSFMAGIPSAISESAKIDGANDFVIFARLILPLSKPLLATLSLFSALAYWNDWYNCMLFITNENMFNLQYYLQRMLGSAEAMRIVAEKSGIALPSIPLESMKMAMTIIATGPIVLLYPFVQRYFVKGLTIGAVKG